MSSTINNVVHGDVELAYLTPVAYVRAHKEGDARLLVKLTSDNQAYFQLVIVVRNDSLINTIEDLQGKRFAFGDKEAMLQRAVVVGAGMPLEKFGAIAFLGRPYNIVRAVLHNDFDAGIVLETKAHVWENKGLRVLYTSPKLPSFNITVSSHVDDNMYQKLQEALLSLNANQSDDGKVFEALDARYNGFAVTDDKEYNVVRQLIAPFK
jgi:phosphonate transport system substrate-binding protein